MRMTCGCVVWLLLLMPLTTGAVEPPSDESTSPPVAPVPPSDEWGALVRLDATALALLPRMGLGVDHAS